MRLSKERLWAIGYVIIVVGLVFSFYVDERQDRFDARRPADIEAATVKTVRCVVKALRADAQQTKDLREVAASRDEDLVHAITAMSELVRLRVLEGITQNYRTRQAANQYLMQAERFIDESKVLAQAREDNPVPQKICGVVIE